MESSFLSNTSGILYSIYRVSYDKTISSLTLSKDLNVKRTRDKPVIMSK